MASMFALEHPGDSASSSSSSVFALEHPGDSASSSSSSDDEDLCGAAVAVREAVKRRRAFFVLASKVRNKRQRMKPRVSRPAFDWNRHVQDLTPYEFRQMYRMDHACFIKMVKDVTPNLMAIDAKRARIARVAGPVSPTVTMACTMRYLGGGAICDMRIVHGPLSRSRTYTAIWDGITAINHTYKVISPFNDTKKMIKIEHDFRRHTRMGEWLGQAGCLDGVLFKQRAPTVDDVRRHHVSRKDGFHVAAQVVVDYWRRITWFDIGWVPKTHDSMQFFGTALGHRIYGADALPHPFFVNTDSAYQLGRCCITPGGGSDFDWLQSSYRMPGECIFGILKERFSIFQRPLRCRNDRRPALIEATFQLTNYLIDQRAQPITEGMPVGADGKIETYPGRWEEPAELMWRKRYHGRAADPACTPLSADLKHADCPPVLSAGCGKRERMLQLVDAVARSGLTRPAKR